MMNAQFHLFQFNLAVSDPFGRLISEDLLPNRGFGVPQSLSKNPSFSQSHLRLNKIESTHQKESPFHMKNSSFHTKDEEVKSTELDNALDAHCKNIALKELMEEYQKKKNKEENGMKIIKNGVPKSQLPQLRQEQTVQPSVSQRIECLPIPDRSSSMNEKGTSTMGFPQMPPPIMSNGKRGRPPKSHLLGKAFQQKAVIRSMKSLIAENLDIQHNLRRQFNDNLKFDKLLEEIKNCKAKVPAPTSLLFVACYTSSKKTKETFLKSDYGLIFKIMTPRLRQEYEGKEAIYQKIIDSFNAFAQEHQ